MQLSTSTQSGTAPLLQDLPPRLLAGLVVGQRMEAVALTAALKAEQVHLQLADRLIQVTTSSPLAAGQRLQLQVVQHAGQLALQILNPSASSAPVLDTGSRLAVEVLAMPTAKTVLLTLNDRLSAALPKQLLLDVSALGRQFQVGQRLQLEVLQTQPLAVVVRPQQSSLAEQLRSQQRLLLPTVQAATLNPPYLNQALQGPRLPAPVAQQLSQLLSAAAERQTLSGQSLQQAVRQSGVFLEQQLQHAPDTSRQDFKANLLRLAAAIEQQLPTLQDRRVLEPLLRQLPAEIRSALLGFLGQSSQAGQLPLLPGQQWLQQLVGQLQQQVKLGTQAQASQQNALQRAVEAGMLRELLHEVRSLTARLQLNQLAMVRDPDNPQANPVWLMEVPLKDRQELSLLRLRIEQQRRQQASDADTWQVQLNLETVSLGPLQASLSLHQQTINILLIAERPASAELLQQHLHWLQDKLTQLELQVGQMNCRCAPVQWPITDWPASDADDSLLDITV